MAACQYDTNKLGFGCQNQSACTIRVTETGQPPIDSNLCENCAIGVMLRCLLDPTRWSYTLTAGIAAMRVRNKERIMERMPGGS